MKFPLFTILIYHLILYFLIFFTNSLNKFVKFFFSSFFSFGCWVFNIRLHLQYYRDNHFFFHLDSMCSFKTCSLPRPLLFTTRITRFDDTQQYNSISSIVTNHPENWLSFSSVQIAFTCSLFDFLFAFIETGLCYGL